MTEFLERRNFVKRTNAANSQHKGVLLLLDGDNFHEISERWGPVAYEMAIQQIEEVVAAAVREEDLVSYLEGDRFVVYVNRAKLAEGNVIADRIRQSIAATPFEPEHGVRHRLTVSIGGVVAAPKQDTDRLLDLAESCLRHAKHNGRNNVVMKTYFRTTAPAPAQAA